MSWRGRMKLGSGTPANHGAKLTDFVRPPEPSSHFNLEQEQQTRPIALYRTMLPQHNMQRLGLRMVKQTRSTPARNVVQRRFNSTQVNKPDWIVDNAFNREREAVKHHAASTSKLWLRLSIFGVIPCLIGGSINAYNLWNEHWEHWNHLPPLEERTEYSYQNIRTKNFPWGDGDKTIFWNSAVNYHNPDKTG
ncbi:cytochrome c oxidase subunit VIa, putative [Talaromyces stipitatus ATCC 10500]|uniref:Cytochrome c oxidase subunit n=1 Tax=Talaromyces stipitatus (strain ATCC 10500 / CBS 375.48 / QM 6759 / NRRL 1006) TaxID=441959 RepID=B8MMT7_TALSN|nr:cytochrome c oxidase subunit VIa, putative [Talaromyces stipitatus ATCC 10500]EED13843.1 cytochrome c oxidase subunit VIa, putative [Talaromyces stipitatus ATCC 10500]